MTRSIDEVDTRDLRAAAEEVLADVRDDLGDLYTTTDPETGNEVEILYSFRSQHLPCLTCDEDVHLFKNYVLRKKKKTQTALVYCPNPNCEDRLIELDREIPDEVECSTCTMVFEPMSGNSTRAKYTCSNGHKHDIKETLKRLDAKPEFDYYAIQYLTAHGERRIKETNAADIQTVAQAREQLQEQFGDLPIPTQKIPSGDKTSRLTARRYERYDELFSDRHLLTYGKLFQRAAEIDDENVAEFVTTGISNSLG